MLFQAGDAEAGWREAREALALDRIAPDVRKLTPAEREPLQKWLGQAPPN